MKNAELKSFELDNADVITASTGGGGGDGLVHLFNFGDGKNNAIFTYGGEDQEKYLIYTVPEDGIVTIGLVTALNNALGFKSTINENTQFITSGHNIGVKYLSNADKIISDAGTVYNGAYEWVTDHFQKVQ